MDIRNKIFSQICTMIRILNKQQARDLKLIKYVFLQLEFKFKSVIKLYFHIFELIELNYLNCRKNRLKLILYLECPASPDHTERFACPRPDRRGRFRCIDDRSLCDGFYDCPGKEDESPEQCLFYKTVSRHTVLYLATATISF